MNNSKGFASFILLIIIALAVGGVGYYLYSNGILDTVFTKLPISTPSPQISLDQARITISKDGFMPEIIKIKIGQSVEWTNTDTKPHQIASDPHPSHTSLPALGATEPFTTDESLIFTFEQSGTYTYHDHLNPLKFKGTIVVEE